MLDRIRALFAGEHTLPVEEAVTHYEEEREAALERARKRAGELQEAILEAMDGLEDALEALEGYEDADGLAVVEDVTENVARDRLRMVDSFHPSEDPGELHDAVEAFIDDFQTMTQKESAVLDRIGDPARDVFDGLKAVRKANERLGSHLQDRYAAVRTRSRLQELADRHTALGEEIDGLDRELDELDTAAIRNEIAALEEERSQLDDDPRMERKQELEERIEALEDEREAIRSRVRRAARKMERGLKKLVYEARNGDVTLSRETLTVLEDIVDGRVADEFTQPAADIGRAVEAAREALPGGLISDRQRERFDDGADTLTSLDRLREAMEDVTSRIEGAREELDGIDIEDEREQLAIRLEQARNRIKNRSERRRELTRKRERTQEEREEVREEIVDLLNAELPGDYTVTG